MNVYQNILSEKTALGTTAIEATTEITEITERMTTTTISEDEYIIPTIITKTTTKTTTPITSTTTTTTTIQYLSIIHISGSLPTKKLYDSKLFESKYSEDYFDLKENIESEIESIFDSNSLVKTATVSVTDIQEVLDEEGDSEMNSKRRKRSSPDSLVMVVIKYISACSVQVPTSEDKENTTFVESLVNDSIQNADPDLFQSFNKESFSSSLTFKKPRIIEYKSLSQTDIQEKIGSFTV